MPGSHETGEWTVPAADLVRHFGEWRDKANGMPLYVTHHGRPTHVLLSTERYRELMREASQERVTDPLEASQIALLDSTLECVVIVDSAMIVRMVNRAACLQADKAAEELVGFPFETAFPTIHRSFFYRNILRALADRESSAADVPTPSGRWFHAYVVPLAVGAGIVYRNITAEVEAHRLADVKRSVLRAMKANGGIGYARLSPRGFFETADETLRESVGLDEQTLRTTRLANLIPQRSRARFNEAFEAVFAQDEVLSIDTELLSNDGSVIDARMTMLQLRGEYASEGAVVLITRSEAGTVDCNTSPASEHEPARNVA